MITIDGVPYSRRREHRSHIRESMEGTWRNFWVERACHPGDVAGTFLRSWKAYNQRHALWSFRVVTMPGGAVSVYGDNVAQLFRTDESDPAPWLWRVASDFDVLMSAAVNPKRVFLPGEAEVIIRKLEEDDKGRMGAMGAAEIRKLWYVAGVEEGDAFEVAYQEVTGEKNVPDCSDFHGDSLVAGFAIQWLVQREGSLQGPG